MENTNLNRLRALSVPGILVRAYSKWAFRHNILGDNVERLYRVAERKIREELESLEQINPPTGG